MPALSGDPDTLGYPARVHPIATGLLLALLLAPAARAATPASAATAAVHQTDSGAADWVGRYCTPTGCAGVPARPLVQATSFGAASLAIALLSRRRRA